MEPQVVPPVMGDNYALILGCRKRLADCRDKWKNVFNFGRFPNIPSSSTYSEIGSATGLGRSEKEKRNNCMVRQLCLLLTG